MGGDSPVILLSSSYAFGAKNFDVDTALKYMVKAGIAARQRPARRLRAPLPRRLPQTRLRAQREGFHLRFAHARVRQRRLRHRPVRAQHGPRLRVPDLPQAARRTGRTSSIPRRTGSARATPMAPGRPDSIPNIRCPSAPTRRSPPIRTDSKRATPTSTRS